MTARGIPRGGRKTISRFLIVSVAVLVVSAAPALAAGVFQPSDLANLALWLDASDINADGTPDAIPNGTVLTQWSDRSGLGRDANGVIGTPTYVAASPSANNAPVVNFSSAGGTDQLFTSYNFDGLGADYTIFGVSRYTGGDNERVITSKTRNWLFGHWSSGDERWYAEGWIHQAGSANTDWHLYAGAIGPSVNANAGDPGADFWKDGTLLTALDQGSNNSAYKPGALALGAWTGGGESSNAEVGEVIIYDRHLTAIERNQVGAYLQDKYGLAGPYSSSITSATTGSFTGGDPGEGLDVEGDFVYAANVRGPAAGAVGDANFTADNVSGLAIGAANEILNWHNPEYGSTSSDNNLETVMQSIRWTSAPGTVTAQADVVPGNTYKLQMLFAESTSNRGFDVSVEGVRVVDNFNPGVAQGGINNTARGALVTVEFTARDDTLNIELNGNTAPFPDHNAIVNGLTLEQVAAKPVQPPITTERIRLHLGEPTGSTKAVDAAFADGVQSGTYQGSPTLGVAGIPANTGVDTAVRFNGSGDFVRVIDAPDPTAYTMEAWVNMDTMPAGWANVIWRTDSGESGAFSHILQVLGDGKIRHYTYDGAGRIVDSTTQIQPGQWHQVVGTAVNGGAMKLYVDGNLEATLGGSLGTLWAGGDRWVLAKPHGGGTNYLEGSLDEVAVYASELSAEQVWLHYRQGIIAAPRDDTPASGPGVRTLDLADVVGGGSGYGTGTFDAGINPATGALVAAGTPNPGQINANGFQTVALPFVDGVFIPDTVGGYMQIASTGLTMDHNYPGRDGRSWGYFRNGPTGGVSPVLNGVDYTADGNSLIGMHANKGITFDLDAIRAANDGLEIGSFSAVFGDASFNGGLTDVNVYLDGVLMYGAGGNQALPQNIRDIHVPISASDRFLTLVATDGGDSYSDDQTMYGNPRLELGKNIAAGKPVFASASYNGFPASNLTDGDLNDIYPGDAEGRSFWLGPDGQTPTLIVDLEGEFLINRIDLQNTRNGTFADRGTSDFTLLVSLDGAEWTEILQDTLADQRSTSWAMPLETFTFANTWARYVKLQVDGYHGNKGAGLNEIRVYEAVPEPATMALLGLAAAGLGGYLRRRRTRA